MDTQTWYHILSDVQKFFKNQMKKIQLKSKMKRRYDFLNIQDMAANKVLLKRLKSRGLNECMKKNYVIKIFKWLQVLRLLFRLEDFVMPLVMPR